MPTVMSRWSNLDIIRGLALLGILIFNIQTYALFALLRPEQVYALQLDAPRSYAPLQFLIHVLVKGEFYTIYCVLFGIGAHLMLRKNAALGLDAARIFRRRQWALLLFGLLHAFLFWFGDVLHKYALLGFTLLYFDRKPVTVLVRWIAALALLAVAVQIALAALPAPSPAQAAASLARFDHVVMQVVDTWQHGSVWQVGQLQKLGVAMLAVMSLRSGLAGYVHFEIMFLLGLIVAKTGVPARIAALRRPLRRAAWLLLPAGLGLKAAANLDLLDLTLLPAAWGRYEALLRGLADFIGAPLLCVAYLIGLALLLQRPPSRPLRWIANAGRMGLSNYLAQTAICMPLFYGYGLGLSGRLTLAGAVGVALLIYMLQVAASNLWLRHHDSGPMEALWRRLSYGPALAPPLAGAPSLAEWSLSSARQAYVMADATASRAYRAGASPTWRVKATLKALAEP